MQNDNEETADRKPRRISDTRHLKVVFRRLEALSNNQQAVAGAS